MKTPLRVTIRKDLAMNEQIEITGDWDGTPAGWTQRFLPAFHMIDGRFFAMNQRMLLGTAKAADLPPEVAEKLWAAVRAISGVYLPEEVRTAAAPVNGDERDALAATEPA